MMLASCRTIAEAIEDAITDLEDPGRILETGADGMPTTAVDKAAEDAALEVIRDLGLPCRVLSEEAGLVPFPGEPEYTLILDPIDGTHNAVIGFPYYGVSVARLKDGNIDYSYVRNLASGDEYWTEDGKAYCNNREVQVSNVTEVPDSFLVMSGPADESSYEAVKDAVLGCRKMRIPGAVALDLALVAAGAFDAFLEIKHGLKVMDYAAGVYLIECAGGVSSTLRGGPVPLPLDASVHTKIAAACTQELLDALLSPLR